MRLFSEPEIAGSSPARVVCDDWQMFRTLSQQTPCGLMGKAPAFGTKERRIESGICDDWQRFRTLSNQKSGLTFYLSLALWSNGQGCFGTRDCRIESCQGHWRRLANVSGPEQTDVVPIVLHWPCGLMDKALVFGTRDCRFVLCQGHLRRLAEVSDFEQPEVGPDVLPVTGPVV